MSNSDTKELHSTKQDLRTYIDSVKKDSEAYPEQNTVHFEKVANIIVNIYSINLKKNQNGIEEYCQEKCHISLKQN